MPVPPAAVCPVVGVPLHGRRAGRSPQPTPRPTPRPTSRVLYAVGLRATQCARLLRPLRCPCPSSAISRADSCSFGGYGRVAGGAGPWSGPVRRGYPGKCRPRRIAARARPGCRARAWRRGASLTPESARASPAGCAGAGRGRGGPRRGGAVCGWGPGRGRATAAVRHPGKVRGRPVGCPRRRLEARPGFEPGIKALQASALPLGHLANAMKKADTRPAPLNHGAGYGDRTRDLHLGKVARYQLR